MQPKTSFKKSRLLRLLVVGVLTAMPVAAQSTPQQPKGTEVQQAQKKYDELVKRGKSGDKTVDFIELISSASDSISISVATLAGALNDTERLSDQNDA